MKLGVSYDSSQVYCTLHIAAQVKHVELNGSSGQIRSDSGFFFLLELNSSGRRSCASVTDVTRDLLLGFGRCPFGFCLPKNIFKLQFVTLLCHISKQCEMSRGMI